MSASDAKADAFPKLDPGIVQFLDLLGTAAAPPFDPATASAPEFRRNAARSRAPLNEGAPDLGDIRELTIGTLWGAVPARLLRRDASKRTPAIVYMHGGGWVIGSIDTHRRLMAEYAAATGFAVIGLGYALAPEAPFPAALYQCAAVCKAVRDMADVLNIDPERVAMAGDSAGANLAVAASLALAEAGAPLPSALILSYGVYDSDLRRPSYQANDRPELLLSTAKMAWFWDAYVPALAMRRHPLAAPLHADLSPLPPILVTVAEADILADENRAFAEEARAAGVPVDIEVWPGTVHGFIEGVGVAAIGKAALEAQCHWLMERMG